jgi:hypothetical protein
METLIAAGEELGKIKKGSISVNQFRNSLNDKWLDTEVMELGFGRFAEFSEAVSKFVNGDLEGFSDEIKKLYDPNQAYTAAEAMELLADHYDELGVKAFKSAQEAKTFTEAIDATKDAVSSGWLKTFEIIFGNYEEAKKLWTDLANLLWDVFASGAEARNEMLTLALGSKWDQLTDQVEKAGLSVDNYSDLVIETARENGIAIDDLISEYGSLAQVINKGERIAQGAFFNFLVADNGNTDAIREGGFGSSGK